MKPHKAWDTSHTICLPLSHPSLTLLLLFQVKKAVLDYFVSVGAGNILRVVLWPPVPASDWSPAPEVACDWSSVCAGGGLSVCTVSIWVSVVREDISADTPCRLAGRHTATNWQPRLLYNRKYCKWQLCIPWYSDCMSQWTSVWIPISKPKVVFTDRLELQEEITGSPLVWVVLAPCPPMASTSRGPHKRAAMRPPAPPPSPPPCTARWVTVLPTGEAISN